jgi:hypothetical protein
VLQIVGSLLMTSFLLWGPVAGTMHRIAPDHWRFDDDLNLVHPNSQCPCGDWTACLARKGEFKLVLALTPPAPAPVPGGRPAEAGERLNKGWSGHRQTWALAHDVAFGATCEGLRGARTVGKIGHLSPHWTRLAYPCIRVSRNNWGD